MKKKTKQPKTSNKKSAFFSPNNSFSSTSSSSNATSPAPETKQQTLSNFFQVKHRQPIDIQIIEPKEFKVDRIENSLFLQRAGGLRIVVPYGGNIVSMVQQAQKDSKKNNTAKKTKEKMANFYPQTTKIDLSTFFSKDKKNEQRI